MENYLIEKKFFALTRIYKDGTKECLINFHKDFDQSLLRKTKIKLNVNTIYIYVNDLFDEDLTNSYNGKLITETESLPYFDFTKNPINVSMESDNLWSDVRDKVFIPNPNNDWDFFQTDWILHKWNSSLGFFDYDSFLIIPTYPKDLINNVIQPEIIIYTIKRYLKKNSMETFKTKYYALYLFYRNKLGREMLRFFYEETVDETKEILQLIKKLHRIYHLIDAKNIFRPFLFYQANCIQSRLRMKFDIKKYILLFLSFHSIYFCNHFAQNRKEHIFNGLKTSSKLAAIQQYFDSPDSVYTEINKVHEFHGDIITWMSRDHFKKVNTPLAKHIYHHWQYMRRNIYLWDLKIFGFIDSQFVTGLPLQDMFPHTWVQNFHKKDYQFELLPKRIRPKRKLK